MNEHRDFLALFFAICAALLSLSFLPPASLQAQEITSYHPLGEWRTITSNYGYRKNPFGRGGRQFHRGLDLAVQIGDSVFAWREGIVLSTDYNRISGNMITLLHPEGYVSKYHHLHRIMVEEGEIVEAGHWVGKAGRSGQVTGPHLHFTLMKNEKFIDPLPYLRQSKSVHDSLHKTNFATLPIFKNTQIRSQPSGRKVYINGVYQGDTPLSLSLAYGNHFLEIDGGSDFQSDRRRIEVEQDSEGILSAVLKPVAENKKIDDSNLGYGPVDQGTFAGITLQVSAPIALSDPLRDQITSRWQLEAGLAWYPGDSKWLTSPWLETRFLLASGEVEPNRLSFPFDDNNSQDTLIDYRIRAVAISYGRSARFFDRLELLAALDLGLGRWTFQTLDSMSEIKSFSVFYFTPAWIAGATYQIDPRLDLSLRYTQSFVARQTNWKHWQIGLMLRL